MSLFSAIFAQAGPWMPLLAQQDEAEASYGVCLILALLPIILGVVATTRVDQREPEIKR